LSSSAKQQNKRTEFWVLWRTCTYHGKVPFLYLNVNVTPNDLVEGAGDGSPGVKGAGEVGGGAGSRILKVPASGRNREKYTTLRNFSWEAAKIRREPGLKGTGSGRFKPPSPPPPPHDLSSWILWPHYVNCTIMKDMNLLLRRRFLGVAVVLA